jgi:hypothetical protein
VYGPPQAGAGAPAGDRGEYSAVRHELLRLKSTAALMDDAASLSADFASEELARWYPAWEQRFTAARDTLHWRSLLANQLATADNIAPGEVETEARGVMKQHALVAKRLASQASTGARPTVAQTAALSDVASELHRGEPAALATFRGAVHPVRFEYTERRASDLSERIVWAILLAAGTIALVISLQGRELPQFSPFTIGAAVGLVGWLAFAPSGLWFVLLVLCLAARVREYWLQVGSAHKPAAG